jgi:hypothetical protein
MLDVKLAVVDDDGEPRVGTVEWNICSLVDSSLPVGELLARTELVVVALVVALVVAVVEVLAC